MSAQAVLIVGESGSGKSHSIQTLDPSQTFIINIAHKALPFKGWKKGYTELSSSNSNGNLYNTADADVIIKTLDYISEKRPEIKNIVIEDFQYMAVDFLMSKIKETGFTKFTDAANKIYKVATKVRSLRDDLIVFFLNHLDINTTLEGEKFMKAKVSGKMIENQVTLEGLFTIVLFTFKEETKNGESYGFITNGFQGSTCKSPEGMFEAKKIENDLNFVAEKIREYELG